MEYRNPKDLKPHPISAELYGENDISDIKESIEQLGVLVPLIITENGLIISGHRRWRSALELNLTTIPIEVKAFADDLAEKQTILHYNRQREKTFSQKINEAKLLKEIVAELARIKQENKTRNNKGQFIHEPNVGTVDKTANIVGRETGIGGRTTFLKGEKIWDKAQEGDRQAIALVKELDAGNKTINKAFDEMCGTPPHISFNTGENEWYTPQNYIEAVIKVLGVIDLDPASSDKANNVIKATKYHTLKDNGLSHDWKGRVWLNPPYAQPLVSQFCEKLVREVRQRNTIEAIVLVNNATETKWFQKVASIATAICFPLGRVKFLSPSNESAYPLQGQAIFYIGNNKKLFFNIFDSFGLLVDIYEFPE